MMKAKDLRQKTVVELKASLTDLLKEQLKLRLTKNGDDQASQNHKFKAIRRTIARVLTVMAEKNKEGNA